MKRLFTALSAVAALTLIPAQVAAGPIVIDPIIGVRGLDVGSTASNNSDFVNMGSCGGETDPLNVFFGPNNVFCESYFIQTPIGSVDGGQLYFESLTFRFADAGGGIINDAIFPDSYRDDDYVPSGQNEFNDFVREEGGFAVTLSLEEGFRSCAAASPTSEFHMTCFQVYLAIPLNETVNGPYRVSLTAINGIQQDATLAPIPNAVPEPGSLLLLGTGLATLVGSRFRRKTT